MRLVLAVAVVFSGGCLGMVGEPSPPEPLPLDPPVDAGLEVDSGAPDADAGAPAPDAGPVDAGVPDAGPEPVPDAGPRRVPIFVAQGKLGRTTVSCDDGRTWRADRSEVPAGRCWDNSSPNNIECDHHAWSSVGVIFTGEHFLATYGWGYPGMVRRSSDGVTWQDVLPGQTFAGMAAGNGLVIGNARFPYRSTDDGAMWTRMGDIGATGWTARRIGFDPAAGGRFIITMDGEIHVSDATGTMWRPATTRPSTCAVNTSGIVAGNGVIVLTQGDGSVCRSTDRGDTWSHQKVTGSFSSAALFEGGLFWVWEGSRRWHSTDGATWTSAAGAPSNIEIGAVARSRDGTFVAVRGGWQVWYDQQRFYRSTDGLSWEVLPTTAFNPSHPITNIAFGLAEPSTVCP